MTVIRRVVSGHDKEGRAVVASDEQLSGLDIPGMSGFEILNIWGSDQTHQYPDDGSKPDYQNFFAPVGGYRFLIFTVPPDSPIEVNEGDKPPSEMRLNFRVYCKPLNRTHLACTVPQRSTCCMSSKGVVN